MKIPKEKAGMKDSIIKRGNSYSAAVYVGRDDDGKKHYKWVSARSRPEVKIKMAELKARYLTGCFTNPKGTFGDYIQRWLEDYAKPNLSPRTYEGYQSIYRSGIQSVLGKIKLRDLKPFQIQSYLSGMISKGNKTTTVRHHAMMIHGILRSAVKSELLYRNPADSVTPPAVRQTEMKTLDSEQVNLLLEAAKDTPYFYEFHVALYTGMRRSELMALRWQDVDLIMAEISVSRSIHILNDRQIIFRGTKTAKSSRRVALSPETCIVLRRHLDNEMIRCAQLGVPFNKDRLLFCEWDGQPLSPDRISRAWERLIKKLGFGHIRFHDARHTHATMLLKANIHPKVVQERLGHSKSSTTLDMYSHVTPGMQQKAAEAFENMLVSHTMDR
jgi:integrase